MAALETVPAAPLLRVARDLYERRSDIPISGDGQVAGLLGVSRYVVGRWKARGIPIADAYDACVRLDVDPECLWPQLDWWLVAP